MRSKSCTNCIFYAEHLPELQKSIANIEWLFSVMDKKILNKNLFIAFAKSCNNYAEKQE